MKQLAGTCASDQRLTYDIRSCSRRLKSDPSAAKHFARMRGVISTLLSSISPFSRLSPMP